MSASPTDRRDTTEPGPDTRGHLSRVWDVIFDLLRFIARYAHNVYATFGIFVLIGAAFALAGTWAFAMLAGHVTSGGTQAFDDAVLQWLGARRAPTLDAVMLEITSLGTTSVVTMVVGVAALFLWLNKHKHSAILLLVATFGGILLNNLLKAGFSRPRPDVIPWATTATFYSFPSGHGRLPRRTAPADARGAPCHHLRRGDRRLHHLHQPALPRRPLSIRRPCWGHHRPRLGRLLHGDSRGNPALCSAQRAATAARRAPRACARVLAELPMLGHTHLLAHIQHGAR